MDCSPPLTPPVILSIAGSDCSSGAGIQADLKTFSYHGCHGLTALTCVVAETPKLVRSIHPVPPAILQHQLEVLLSTYPIKAIKTGMLYSKAHLVALYEMLEKCNIPLIVDPVMVASSGSKLMDKSGVEAYKERLLPLAALVTPNMPEASVLLDRPITDKADLEPAAQEIAERYHTSCLLKGGHLPGDEDRLDVLWHEGKAHHFTAPMISIENAHGTGCALSAAITAQLAHQVSMELAVAASLDWLHSAIKNAFLWESSEQGKIYCLNHLSDFGKHTEILEES